MEYSLKEVAGRIKGLREAKGYSQEELARLTGVSFEDYKVLEEGETDKLYLHLQMRKGVRCRGG